MGSLAKFRRDKREISIKIISEVHTIKERISHRCNDNGNQGQLMCIQIQYWQHIQIAKQIVKLILSVFSIGVFGMMLVKLILMR